MTCTLLIIGFVALGTAPASGSPALVEIIEIGGIGNNLDVYDFVFVDEFGNATMQSWNDDDGDTIVATSVPPTPSVTQKFVHNPLCSFMLISNVDPLPTGTQQAVVPLLKDLATGNTLVPDVSVLDLGVTPDLPLGTQFPVVNGMTGVLPMATILAPAMSFNDIPLPLFSDPGIFPPFNGTAEVVDHLDVTVTVRCASDVNGDGAVDVVDLLQMLALWGPCAAPCLEDGNFDGEIGVQDLLNLLADWGPCP